MSTAEEVGLVMTGWYGHGLAEWLLMSTLVTVYWVALAVLVVWLVRPPAHGGPQQHTRREHRKPRRQPPPAV